MKFIFLLFLLSSFSFSSEIPWSSSLEEGLSLSKQKLVPVIVEFYTDWCKYCQVLDSKILPHPEIQEQLKNFQTVRINGETHKELTLKYKIVAYPTLLILDSDETNFVKIVGLPSVEILKYRLRYALIKKEEKELLLKKLEAEPNSPLHLYNLGRLHYELENYEQSQGLALQSYQNSNELTEKRKEALFLLGMSLFRLKKYVDSISVWTQYLNDYPEEDIGITLYYRGISYLENGDIEKSKQDLKRCIQIVNHEKIKASAKQIYNSNFTQEENLE